MKRKEQSKNMNKQTDPQSAQKKTKNPKQEHKSTHGIDAERSE